MTIVKMNLDNERPNASLRNVLFKQGNANRQLEITLYDNGELHTLDPGDKPTLIVDFYDNTNKVVAEYVVKDGETADYNITVSGNVITVPPRKELTEHSGNAKLSILLDDLYTYEVDYTVSPTTNYKYNTPTHNIPSFAGLAKADLSNVADSTLKGRNLAFNDLADVDLSKLYDKGLDAKLGAADLTNVSPIAFNRELQQNKAFQLLENRHPATAGLTAEEIKKLFFAARYEETTPVDLTQPPFDTPTTLMLVCQITSEGQVFKQVLPPQQTPQSVCG